MLEELTTGSSITGCGQWVCENAISSGGQASSAAMDSYSALLSLQPGSRSPVWAQQRSLGLLTVQLGMDVRWPLSVVIGQVCPITVLNEMACNTVLVQSIS